MQTVETLNEGLKRAYKVTIPANDVAKRVEAEIKSIAPQIKMPGFRPGKVPTNLVKKMHGASIEQDVLQKAVQDGIQTLLVEQKLRPAVQPSVELEEGYESGKDVELKVALEVLPDVPAPSIDGLTLERLTVDAADAEIDAALARIAGQQKQFADALEGHPAVEGDLVVMDFAGKVDGVAFEGGTGEGMSIELGSGRLIPGFEEQLEGVKNGEERTLNVTFPADYPEKKLAGKAATFDVKVTDIRIPKEAVADEEFAKSLGLDGLETLRNLVKGQVEQELNGLTRTHMKRKLLDQLAESHSFDVPPSMVEAEFEQIWAQLEHEAGHEADPEAARAEMEKDRDDYRAIAERRVRLGLLLSEIGQQNNVQISEQEMQRLIMQAAGQYGPKDRDRFIQYVQQDPMAAAQLRAPLYEDKVVDFLFEKATVTDRAVSREELETAIEADDDSIGKGHVHGPDCGHDHDHDHGHVHGPDCDHDHDVKPAAKKAAPKKAAAKKAEAPAETTEAEAAPAPKKKAPAKKAEAAPAEETAEAAPKKAPAKKAPAKKAPAKDA
ncbi:trigger factor [Sphingomonas montanisoli]|uniref:Trigger factor n=1 Tax=Sphingomonas montanisoli TaxID=2606412 RepID=A0A5D9CCA8_9SPHN|nr:trigger factor [Sphingomonas montanisoli]TZG28976.1 trigger factor [Sphingomonas montanisoli]